MQTIEKQAPKRSIGDLNQQSAELARNAIALNPKLPAANLLAEILSLAEPEFLQELDAVLRARHFLGVIRAERAKDRRAQCESAWLSPQIRIAALTLPAHVPIGGDKKIPRNKMEYPHTALYLKFLDREDRDRKTKDARRAAIKEIRKLWPRAKKRPRVMTLAEVDRARAERAGLI